jgi:hypothetical protein
MRRLILSIALAALPLPALAEGYVPVMDKGQFLQLVEGRELQIGVYGLKLQVRPDGKIEGTAFGKDVSGKWAWKNGYFCRDLRVGKRDIPYNCQLVEAKGASALRFTSDQGNGESADFRLR